ncbi:MAG: DUF4956 domain-containing protein [Candidatus Rifleibacteriota bacterium]
MNENQFSQPLLKLIDLNAYDVFWGMILSFLLCAFLSRLSSFVSAYAERDKNLGKTMILLGTIVSLIMAVIGNSLARAFGAIGALSLVRFRTAVKSSNDLAYIFMAISVGMACGSGYFAIASGAAALYAVFIILTERFFSESVAKRIALIKICYVYDEKLYQSIVDKIAEMAIAYRKLSEETTGSGNSSEMLFEMTLKTENDSAEIVKELGKLSESIKASILLQ